MRQTPKGNDHQIYNWRIYARTKNNTRTVSRTHIVRTISYSDTEISINSHCGQNQTAKSLNFGNKTSLWQNFNIFQVIHQIVTNITFVTDRYLGILLLNPSLLNQMSVVKIKPEVMLDNQNMCVLTKRRLKCVFMVYSHGYLVSVFTTNLTLNS